MTVSAKMESYLVKTNELEHTKGPEDSEVNLMYILTKAIRSSSSFFEIVITSGSDHLVARRLRSKRDCKEEQARMATKATSAGLKQVKGWQEEC